MVEDGSNIGIFGTPKGPVIIGADVMRQSEKSSDKKQIGITLSGDCLIILQMLIKIAHIIFLILNNIAADNI